jgi:transcriptional regulator GlxA family with amidase domain
MSKNNKITRNVIVVAFNQCQVLDVSGPVEALEKANITLGYTHYTIALVSNAVGQVKTSGAVSLFVDRDYASISDDELASLDTLIIAGGNGVKEAIKNKDLLSLATRASKTARRVVSICSGAYVLAELGLLDGRHATTHWDCAADFELRYPDVLLDIDSIYVRDGQFWTSAGITAGIDLALALIEEDHGSRVALRVARQLVVYMMRAGGQAQFSAQLKLQRTHDTQLRSLVEWVDANPDSDLSVAKLAERCAMSERNFNRRFREETNLTPARYVEQSRLEHARRRLEESDQSLQKISDLCGCKSVEVMRRLFQRKLGVSPGLYWQRFRTSLRNVTS